MDRILRNLPGMMAAALLGLAAVAGQAAPNDGVGEELAQPALSPPAPPGELSFRKLPAPATEISAADAPAEMLPALASPLATAKPGHERSEQLEQIARQVDRQAQHGFDLAGRGAFFAARSEFFAALKILAEGLDAENKTDSHRRALTAALTAMREAEDFIPGKSHAETGADLARIIAAHTTPVVKNEAGNVNAMTALRCYLTFAQEQFAAASGDEVAGSMTLYALGKLHNALAQKKSGLVAGTESKAMVFYQAALLSYPDNFMAANDLGVLLAQCGNDADARTMLEHSLSLSPQSATWHNLAVVYGRLGEPALARQADQQAAMQQQAELVRRKMALGTADNSVLWIDTQSFATTSNNAPNTPSAAPQQQTPAAPPAEPGRMPPAVSAARAAQAPSAAERLSWRARTHNQ